MMKTIKKECKEVMSYLAEPRPRILKDFCAFVFKMKLMNKSIGSSDHDLVKFFVSESFAMIFASSFNHLS